MEKRAAEHKEVVVGVAMIKDDEGKVMQDEKIAAKE